MDFIEAEDFATIALREVILRSPVAELSKYGLREGEPVGDFVGSFHDIAMLHDLVGRLLHLENPQRADKNGMPYTDRAALLRNSKRIFSFLTSRGWSVHPRISRQLANTMTALHEAGIQHRDAHERNIMIAGDPTSENAQAYLIDFGTANHRSYSEEEVRDEMAIVKLLQEVSESKEARQGRERQEEEQYYREDLKRYHERARTHELYAKFRERFLHDPEKTMEELRIQDERTLSQTALLLIGAVSERLLTPLEATQAIDSLKVKNKNIPLGKKMSWLANYIRDLVYV
jgi:serine/threonine protein kinase